MARKLSFDPKSLGPLTIGLDIGIASVGWAVLSPTRIVDLGVRCFDRAENEKGEPLNLNRRTLRTARKRIRRRVQRLTKLRRIMREAGLIATQDVSLLVAEPNEKRGANLKSPWALRARALDEKLSPLDWARVLYHLVKRRGFFAARKSETIDETKDGGKMTQGIRRTAALLGPTDARTYRTLGEMAWKANEFADSKRNKAGEYKKSFARTMLRDELKLLFAQQRTCGNPDASVSFEEQIEQLFWFQRPALDAAAMRNLVGRCTFEKAEFRAAKRSFSAERFVWLTKLNNLRISENGERRALTPGERQALINLPYTKKSAVKYQDARKAIGLENSEAGFVGLSYGSKRNKKGELVDPESATLMDLKGWHDIRKVLEANELAETWQRLSSAAFSGDPTAIDGIADAVSLNKTDAELRPALVSLGLAENEADVLLALDFSDFIQLSFVALKKILDPMERGERYDEACKIAGYNHAKPDGDAVGVIRLPKLAFSDVRNPVVYRAFNQARRVLNAIIDLYGSPSAVHVELARDLSKPFDERREIKDAQKAFQVEKEHAANEFREHFSRDPKRDELLKLRLYREQQGKCAYSVKGLDIHRLPEQGYAEIDHILPYSRSFDDSQNNKVLVLAEENQQKGNRTPYEYLNGETDSERWRQMLGWLLGTKSIRKAKRDRLLRKSFTGEDAEGFKARNLNDTRYATRLISNHISQHLRFAPGVEGVVAKLPVLNPAGGFTSFLRARWGLIKNREASDLHHALDACVIAAATRSLQKRISDFHRRDELVQLSDGTFADRASGEILSPDAAKALGEYFPQPWANFRDEVQLRLHPEPHLGLNEYFTNYDEAARAAVRPVLVSRAVKRLAGGAVHEDTIRSIKPHLGEATSSKRTPLANLKLSTLDDVVGADDARNAGLMYVLRLRLEDAGGDGKKAFGPNMPPVYKPRKDLTDGPLIRAVQVKTTQKGGVPVRGGVADQASMWRVDVFEKAGKFYLVPIYQSDRGKGRVLPNRASTANTPRDQWTLIDETFSFQFSLCANDYVLLKNKKMNISGYFAGLDIATAAISILSHDRSASVGKEGLMRSLGVKVGTEIFAKMHVDILGNRYTAKPEKRGDLA